MIALRAAASAAVVALAVVACSSADDVDRTPSCSFDDRATTCAGAVTMECFYGATPAATEPCKLLVANGDTALFCCGP